MVILEMFFPENMSMNPKNVPCSGLEELPQGLGIEARGDDLRAHAVDGEQQQGEDDPLAQFGNDENIADEADQFSSP